jgi:DNA-binding NtrC family response regulator
MKNPDQPPVVLVVDDDALLRWSAADVLTTAGYQVIEADDAASALRIIAEQPDIRVMFTDVQMPGEHDGMALAAKVHERRPEILLLVTSGRLNISEDDIADHGRFVAKPYSDQALVAKISSLIADQESGALG